MKQFKQYWQVYFILFFGLFILFAGVIWLDIYINDLNF